MDESTKPNTDWRDHIAAITGQVSGLEQRFGKLYDSIQPLLDSIGERSAMFRSIAVPDIRSDLLKDWTEQQKVLAAALQERFNTPSWQALSKSLSEWQITGLQKAFQAPEYQQLFAQIAEAQKSWAQNILSQIGPAFARFQSTALQESWSALSKVVAEGMKRTRNALERVELLAALGWTLPMEMSLPEFHALVMQDGLSVGAVEEWFIDYYSRDEGLEFNSLKKHLMNSDHLAFWRPLLAQVFDAYSRGQFAVCVPSLLSVLEGSIAVPWNVTAFHKERCRKGFFEERINTTRPDSIRRFQWKSVAAFVLTVFEGVDPNREYSTPKRNLILHGKSDPATWDQADRLRLLQSIDTILSLGHELDSTEPKGNGHNLEK